VGRRPLRRHVRRQLALEHRADEGDSPADRFDARDIGGESAVEAGGQRRSEVACLICVRQQHVRGRQSGDHLLEGDRVAVWRVEVEGRMVGDDDPVDACSGHLGRRGVDLGAEHDHRDSRVQRPDPAQLFRPRHRFPRRAIELAATLFSNDQDHWGPCMSGRHGADKGSRNLWSFRVLRNPVT
jgi:hypothetical protein